MLSSGILNLPIYGRQKQLKPCFVLKCVDLWLLLFVMGGGLISHF
jgi:hypothetical protein